ncbi:MAG TPA: tetratricopeptide repeat protein [Polyangiaceae bacterium]|nr:tetratricopeptide repeat protein [Polyangiaceae bacterium]
MRNRSRIETRALAVLILLLILLLGLVRTAHAQTVDELVKRGGDLYESGKPAEAASEWEKALAQLGESGWKIHYNLGLAYEAAGDVTRAVDHYDAFLRRVAAEAAALPAELEERREDGAARVSALKASHGALVLPPQPTEVTARIDAEPARRVGYTAYVKPGKHVIVIAAQGGAERRRDIDAAAGSSIQIDTTDPTPRIAPAPTPRPRPYDEPPPAREFPTVVVIVGASLTALSFAGPIIAWHLAAEQRNEATALGVGHSQYPIASDEYESARTRYYATYAVPAGLGAITLGVAIWGFIYISNDPAKVRAAIGPNGVSIEGRF